MGYSGANLDLFIFFCSMARVSQTGWAQTRFGLRFDRVLRLPRYIIVQMASLMPHTSAPRPPLPLSLNRYVNNGRSTKSGAFAVPAGSRQARPIFSC